MDGLQRPPGKDPSPDSVWDPLRGPGAPPKRDPKTQTIPRTANTHSTSRKILINDSARRNARSD